MADIAAIVVTHQSAETIEDCLRRLRASEGVAAIRVVDNASRDGTLEIVQRYALADPRVRFIANPDNPGFAVACNQGANDIARASIAEHTGHDAGTGGATWLAFVNPDCLVETDSLVRLRDAAASLCGDAVIGADLVDETGMRDDAARRRDPDFAAMLRGAFSGRDARAALAIAIDDAVALQIVDAVSGALMLMPRAVFDRIGGFDTGYRLHAEDLDLCRRARDSGARVAVANNVRIIHVRGVSSRARPLFVEWHKHRGLWRYFSKFEAQRRGIAMRVMVFVAIWVRFPLVALKAVRRVRV